MDDYRARKAARVAHYAKYVHGRKLRDCAACNGSGRYDSNGSPPCVACGGTGRERYKPESTDRRTPEAE